MRFRPQTWFLLSVFLFLAAFYSWRLGDEWEARKEAARQAKPAPAQSGHNALVTKPAASTPSAPFTLLNTGLPAASKRARRASVSKAERLRYRLTNSTRTAGQLARSDKAILLQNLLLDTTQPIGLSIPDDLKSKDPGSYIVQAGKPLDAAFRARLQAAGATIVSYIPNDAYLVRASAGAAEQLSADPDTTVLAYEPYFKLQPSLLALAMELRPLPENAVLNVLLFPDARAATLDALQQMGAQVLSEEPSPFGTVVKVRETDAFTGQPAAFLPALAGLPGVQELEMAHHRAPANDLSRFAVGVAANSQTNANFLGLTGTNIFVNINDTGVDTNHPDLKGRVMIDIPYSGMDSNGHGTHVAGTIAGTGLESTSTTNAEGSVNPPVPGQFRGMAPGAQLFSMLADPAFGPYYSDYYLQTTAAQTNAALLDGFPFISNNSWTYAGDNGYDLAAASYDAAVRDALPGVTGSQPGLYVFAAGNADWALNIWDDGTDDDGTGGSPDEIESPATAKNVITVGAIELPRNITNNVVICTTVESTNGVTNASTMCNTNQEWQPSTDSSDQVASFSSRGNVGVGVEGDAGRFKPDVVAPGTMVISTRSTEWDQPSYYNPTSYVFQSYSGIQTTTNGLWLNTVFVPDNAVQMTIDVFATDPDVPLTIYVNQPSAPTNSAGGYYAVGTNTLTLPTNGLALNPTGVNWWYGVGDTTNVPVTFDIEISIAVTNQYGDFLEVLSNLNDTIGPYYRYESGTSMAAADVSGTLALMQEFFQQRMHLTNSPALMKALLINGARSAGDLYDFNVSTSINYQGWGLINLPNSLGSLTNGIPAGDGTASTFIFDQNPTNALATGQNYTRTFKVSNPLAQALPLRFTLVWTDPPGNPVAGQKLVNSLLMVVTNTDTGDVFFGNDIESGEDFNLPWNTNNLPNIDVVNNVQNIYLQSPLGSNYTVTVIGNRVNVNAVTDQTNDVVQDYALVVSCGEGELPNALTLTQPPVTPLVTSPLVIYMTNTFAQDPNDVGGVVTNRAGANTPLWGTNTVFLNAGESNAQITVGMTNQWNFFVITNNGPTGDFTNAAFATFLTSDLAVPRMGVFQEGDPPNATTAEADLDLLVSTDPTLTNLVPSTITAAYKSVGRGGNQFIVLSNSVVGTVYYIGVKSEFQEAAQYSFLADFSNIPFGSSDQQGNQYLRGFPAPALIPTGTPQFPGIANIMALGVNPIMLHRVVATNNITADLMGGLLGTLSLNGNISVALNNHAPSGGVTNQTFIYDDSGQKDISDSVHTDGPGTLTSFAGQQGSGEWILSESDNDPSHAGTNNSFGLRLEKQQDLSGERVFVMLGAGGCDTEYIQIPPGATNLTIYGTIVAGTGPVSLQVCPLDGGGCQGTELTVPLATNSVVTDKASDPPLNPGLYGVTICNQGNAPVTVFLLAKLFLNLNPIIPVLFPVAGPTALPDDAVTYSGINVGTNANIVSTEVGVRINHPRISDLALTLISPSGTRVLLYENRGGNSTNGIGTDILSTNTGSASADGGASPQTNVINTGVTSGSIQISYEMYTLPDTMYVYYGAPVTNNLIWTSGLVCCTGQTNLTYPPVGYSGQPTTVITIVMNQFGNSQPTTAWTYTVTSTEAQYNYLTFTEDTNLTTIPIKFAVPPFTNSGPATVNGPAVMSDGFESGPPGYYNNDGTTFSGGWLLGNGDVFVLTNGYHPGFVCDSGNQCLDLIGTNFALAVTNLSLNVGDSYLLTFAYAGNPDGDSQSNAPQTQVYLDGTPLVNLVGSQSNTWTNPGWQKASVVFTAAAPQQQLILQAVAPGAGMLFDTFNVQIQTVQTGLYYLPEESLNKLVGENANGTWQLEVLDDRAGPATGTNNGPVLLSWELGFVFDTPLPGPIALGPEGPITNTVPPGGIQYFTVFVPDWPNDATNILVSATGPLNLLFNQNTPPTGTAAGDFTLLSGVTSGMSTLQASSAPPLVNNATYILGVQNNNAVSVSFVFQVNFDVTALTNNVPVTSSITNGPIPRYFYFDVTSNYTAVSFQLTNNSGNVYLVANDGPPFPTTENYEYGSFNPGSENQEIIIFTNSQPVALAPGRWFIGVFNADVTSVNYTIVANAYTNAVPPNIILLQNGVPYANNNSGVGAATDYYEFIVDSNAVRAQFEIDNPSAQIALVVNDGLPLPTISSYSLISDNPAPSGQLIVLYNYSTPVPLGPGDWFLSAVNVSGGPATYSIMATEWPVYGTNITITNEFFSSNSLCLTWTSVAGFDYIVQGLLTLDTTNWVNISPIITATGPLTTYCIPLPTPYQFFQVIQATGTNSVSLPPVTITSITNSPQGRVLTWMAPTNSQFQVQWTPSIPPAFWSTFSGSVISTNGIFSYLDDGSQSGGLGGTRFYRLVQFP